MNRAGANDVIRPDLRITWMGIRPGTPSDYHNIAAIRKLIRAAFTASDLQRFCRDMPLFRSVVDRFPTKASLDDMTETLIEYCEKKVLFPELLQAVEKANPKQYALYSDQLSTHGLSTGKQRTALVLVADRHTTLNALVELLVEQWDLPVWQDEPIAYDLHTSEGKPLDPARALGDLKKGTELHLIPVTNHLVMAQSPANIPIIEVWHPDATTSLSVLALPEEITAEELENKLVGFWRLPDEEFAFYELILPDGGALLQNRRLGDLGLGSGSHLRLVHREGIRVVRDEEPDGGLPDLANLDSQISANVDITEEQLLALARAVIPEEELKGREKELLAFARQAWEEMLSDDLTVPEPSIDSEGEVIEVVVPPEPTPVVEPESSTAMSGLQFRKQLLYAMDEGLDESDLEHLFFCLGVDSDKFTGNKSSRIIGVIQYYRKRNKLGDLLSELFEMAPHVRERLVELGYKAWLP